MTPEESKKRKAEAARKKYRRLRGLPEDAVLTKTPEQVVEKRRATKRAYARRTRGAVPWDEYVANRRREAEERKSAKELDKIREKLIRDARKAEEREARICRTSTKYGNGMKRKSVSSSRAHIRKPGRLVARAGWMGW